VIPTDLFSFFYYASNLYKLIGYVLVDLYLFIIIAHASYVWMPRPMGSHEYVKYAPLELLEVNGLELWEEDLTADDYFDE
jgi:hypothetical protein